METIATTTVDLTIGVSVADLDGRTVNGVTAEYVTEATEYKVLRAGANPTVSFTFPTKLAAGAGIDGVLEATMETGVGYTPTGGAVFTEIHDSHSTKDILSIDGATPTVVEGNNAIFNVTRTGSSDRLPFQYVVNADPSSSGIYTGRTDPIDADIPADMNDFEIRVPIETTPGLFSRNPVIRVTIQNTRQFKAATYRIGTPADTIDVIDDAPVVSVKGYPSHVTFGHSFTFTVEADSDSNLDMPLTVGISYFPVVDGTYEVVDSNGVKVTNSVTIPTTGSIVLTVNTDPLTETTDHTNQNIDLLAHTSGPEYIISRETGENSVVFDLLNNQIASTSRPRLALEAYLQQFQFNIEDASSLSFNIISTHTPPAGTDVNVNIKLEQTSGNFLTSTTKEPVTLSTTPR